MMRAFRFSCAAIVSVLSFSLSNPAHAQACMGVRIATPEGPRALVGVMALGSMAALERIKAAAEALRLEASPPREADGRLFTVIFFDDSVVTPEQAQELVRRIREGDLSPDGAARVGVDVQIMPIEVLRGCRQ